MKVLAKSNQANVQEVFVNFGFQKIADGLYEMEAPENATTLRWLNPLEPQLHAVVGGFFAISPFLPCELPEELATIIVVEDVNRPHNEVLEESLRMYEEALRASSSDEEAQTYGEKIEKIIAHTGWNQKEVALKIGRDAASITRILVGNEPKTKSLQGRIDDLYHEVFDLKLWKIQHLPEMDADVCGAKDGLRIIFRFADGKGTPESTVVYLDENKSIQQQVYRVCKLNNVFLGDVASTQIIRNCLF
jgi:hypothetical protein